MVLSACDDELEVGADVAARAVADVPSVSHRISKEQALNSLYDFLSESSENGLKSISVVDTTEMWAISTDVSVGCNKSLSTSDGEDLVYVANFSDDRGYAILAADDRISEEVLVVSDGGSVSRSVAVAAKSLASGERVIFDDYPLTGDGFFTVPEYPDELFINPNTVDLYDQEVDDALVGDFSTDDVGEEDEDGNLLAATNKSELIDDGGDGEVLGVAMCLNYARKQVANGRYKEQVRIDELQDEAAPETRVVTEATTWVDSGTESKKLLSNYARWHQHSPFNDLYPRRRKFIIFGHRRKAPAGCFPLAVSKILANFSYPKVFNCNGQVINWNSIRGGYAYNSTEGKRSAAALLYSVSKLCHSKYFYQGTFTFPKRVVSFMKDIGFKNVGKYDYSFSRVRSMIDKECPVLIYAMPHLQITNSHAWNIDGYKIKTRTVTKYTYRGGALVNKSSNTEYREMVHCDFGQEGKGNGYYVSGVFKKSDDDEYDHKYSDNTIKSYNNFIHIITYSYEN